MKIQIDIHASPQDLKDFLHNVVPEIDIPKKPYADMTMKEIDTRMLNLEKLRREKKVSDLIRTIPEKGKGR